MPPTEWTLDALIKQVAQTPGRSGRKQPGDSFSAGRYRVERQLGRGGQKLVYLVHDTMLDRPCALSLALAEHVDHPRRDRFAGEAKALAKFGAHANIVTIYDIGEEDGTPYVLCEYLEGGDLRATLRANGSIEPVRALRIARDVACALAFAHERGVVHRDVTPGNIWLVADGTAKLGDFGLALISGQTRLTTPGGVLGTAGYLAPEQALGLDVDGRTDLYALGCVLYEMLTGQVPFSGDSPLAVVSQHIHAEPVPPDERNPELSPKISALVMRLLAKEPADRVASSTELRQELDWLIGALTDPVDAAWPCPIPDNERERLAAVHALRILDTPTEVEYDELVDLAAQLCGCPMSYLCFIDETRQWMKARHGVPAELVSAPREIGICQTTICQADVLIAPDMTQDERFSALPPVVDPPNLRFYCGVPLVTAQGHALGTLCVMDTNSRELSVQQVEALRVLARQVLARLELRRCAELLARAQASLASSRAAGEASAAVEPRYHESTTIGLARLRGYPKLAADLAPAELVVALDAIVSSLDVGMRQLGLEKLGAADGTYRFAAGLSSADRRHPVVACLGALALRAVAQRADAWEPSLGLHTGPAIWGRIGEWRPTDDLWGLGASLVARIEAQAQPGEILLSASTYERVKELFVCTPADPIEVENRGAMPLFRLERIAPTLSADPEGTRPNEAFAQQVERRFGRVSGA